MTFSVEEVREAVETNDHPIPLRVRSMLQEYAALLEQREAVTKEDVEVAGTAYFEQQWAILPPKSKQVYRFALKRALESYASRHARQVPDDRMQKAINALIWINEDVWPLVHTLTSRETLQQRFRELPTLIEYLAAAPPAPDREYTCR